MNKGAKLFLGLLAAAGGIFGIVAITKKAKAKAVPVPAPVVEYTLMEAISGSQVGTQVWVANSSVASYLASGEWMVVSGTPVPVPTPAPVPVPVPVPTPVPTYVYDQLYFKQTPGQILGIGQIVRISVGQIAEAVSKGWVSAVGLVNAYGLPFIDSSTPLTFYAIWHVGTPLPS